MVTRSSFLNFMPIAKHKSGKIVINRKSLATESFNSIRDLKDQEFQEQERHDKTEKSKKVAQESGNNASQKEKLQSL